jgi:hypothetical protein
MAAKLSGVKREIASSHRVHFPVSNVKPGAERLPEITVRAAMERTAKTEILTWPKAEQLVLAGGDFHPLIAAAAIAYQQHYPLVLSPDIIWLTILQGVAQHVSNNRESLRTRFVPHDTKIELVVASRLTTVPEKDSEMLEATKAFVELIEKHVRPDKRFLLNTEFSTTTDVERIAGAILVMDTFQPYFDYVFSIICGIPSVTLEGTTSDWNLLAFKVRLLHESDLDLSWWTEHLLPLCDQFIRASSGDVDTKHWQNLCKLVERYGVDDLNGWLLKFIPYICKGRNEAPIHRNHVLELLTFDDSPGKRFKINGCTSNMLPTGLSRVPVACQNILSGEKICLQFLAGLVGVGQDKEDLGVRAIVGWGIAKQPVIDALIDKLRTHHGSVAPAKVEASEILKVFEGNLPGDMWRFYSEIEDASVNFLAPNHYGETFCRILDFRSVKPLWESFSVLGEIRSLHEQGELSATFLAGREKFVSTYGHLRKIAWASVGKKTAHYVFGRLPDSDARIHRWNGKRTPEAFTPVSNSFSEWLRDLLSLASP